mgnify:CR=1 FL=1
METSSNPQSLLQRTSFLFVFIILFLTYACYRPANTAAGSLTLLDELDTSQASILTLTTDFDRLLVARDTPAYQAGQLSWTHEGRSYSFDLKVRPRGNYRRQFCDIPPLKLNFEKSQLIAQGFQPFDDWKLVLPCSHDAVSDTLLLREYLAYKIYNRLTDQSLQARLVKVQFAAGESPRFAILLESEQALASRLQATEMSVAKNIDKAQYARVVAFQYFIGNTDWNLSNSHNILLLQGDDGNLPVAVPYDFDHAGLVNAAYAQPHPQLPIKSVRERLLQWRGSAEDPDLKAAMEEIKTHLPDIKKLISEFPPLKAADKTILLDYLQECFKPEASLELQKI